MQTMDIFKAYREAKANADKWKKEAEELGKILKAKLTDTPVVEQDGYRYERKVSVRTKLDEDNLAIWLQDNGFNEALATKLVVNEDKVAEMLNTGDLDVAVIDKFTSKNEVVALYCKKVKAKKGVE